MEASPGQCIPQRISKVGPAPRRSRTKPDRLCRTVQFSAVLYAACRLPHQCSRDWYEHCALPGVHTCVIWHCIYSSECPSFCSRQAQSPALLERSFLCTDEQIANGTRVEVVTYIPFYVVPMHFCPVCLLHSIRCFHALFTGSTKVNSMASEMCRSCDCASFPCWLLLQPAQIEQCCLNRGQEIWPMQAASCHVFCADPNLPHHVTAMLISHIHGRPYILLTAHVDDVIVCLLVRRAVQNATF